MYLLPQKDIIPEGLKWLKLSANQGMQDAQFLLGLTYLKGQNFAHDLVQAEAWKPKAATASGEETKDQPTPK